MQPFLGQICMFGFNFAPRAWANCAGQLLPISQNTALFSLLGTIYGGDGRTTFALPDLRGRVPINMGNGPGLSNYTIGARSGSELRQLLVSNLPSHSHTASFHLGGAATGTALKNSYIAGTTAIPLASSSKSASDTLASDTITVGNTGGSQAFDIRQPFLTINFCIALQGIFPSRN